MKLYEIKGPGDYWAGDESNPRSPDYNPVAGRRVTRRPVDLPDPGADEDQYMRGVKRGIGAQRAATTISKASGNFNGAAYNMVVTFNGRAGESIAAKWIDAERNIYNTVVGKEQTPDGSYRVYVNASPQSLLWNQIR